MLNWAHIHLILTHIPVIGVGVIIAFLLVGKMRESPELQWVSLQMFVALALLSIAVYLTGSPASHQLQKLGVSREVIHRHSQSADFSFTAIEALGTISLAILVKFRVTRQVPSRFSSACLALALVTLALMAWTASLGGRIRHPEIDKSLPASAMQSSTT